MSKKLLAILFLCLFAPCAMAQEVFWGFDENNKELIIPPECDTTTDQKELYEVGMRLLEETGYAKQGAAYCLMAAALGNHPDAQYQIAHLYHRGILLPKSDLGAYKWATIAALNGSAEADLLGANIEQFLSVSDIEAATRSVESLLPDLSQQKEAMLLSENQKQEMLKEEIKIIKKEIKDLKTLGYLRPRPPRKLAKTEEQLEQKMLPKQTETSKNISLMPFSSAKRTKRAAANEAIFSNMDLINAPMPSPY